MPILRLTSVFSAPTGAVLALLCALVLTGCPHEDEDPEPEPPPPPPVAETFTEALMAEQIRPMSDFAGLIDLGGLTAAIDGRRVTGFVPTNGAIADFEEASGDVLNRLWTSDADALASLTAYHLMPDTYSADDLLELADGGIELPSLHPDGLTLVLERDGDSRRIRINGQFDVDVDQAIVGPQYVVFPVVDGMLVPEDLAGDLPQ